MAQGQERPRAPGRPTGRCASGRGQASGRPEGRKWQEGTVLEAERVILAVFLCKKKTCDRTHAFDGSLDG